MLDLFIYIGTVLGFTFFLIGQKWHLAWGHLIALIIFITMGIGLLTTGWVTHDNAPIILQDLNASATQVTFLTTTFTADLAGDAVSQIVFIIGTFYVVLGLVFTFLAIQTAVSNKHARNIPNIYGEVDK